MDEVASNLLQYVCQNFKYRADKGEFWEFPSEVYVERAADCDGTALFLVSMLRRFYPADRVYAVAGTYRGFGHMWVELDGEILETTYTQARSVPSPRNYRAYCKFNDQMVMEMWPGAMGEIFQVQRNECQKLALMV